MRGRGEDTLSGSKTWTEPLAQLKTASDLFCGYTQKKDATHLHLLENVFHTMPAAGIQAEVDLGAVDPRRQKVELWWGQASKPWQATKLALQGTHCHTVRVAPRHQHGEAPTKTWPLGGPFRTTVDKKKTGSWGTAGGASTTVSEG